MASLFRRTRAVIDTQALLHNCQQIHAFAPQSKILATVKADAYGHGAVTVAKALQGCAEQLGVAFIDEALELREAGIAQPIVLLDGCYTAEELALCAEHGFIPVIHSRYQLEELCHQSLKQPLTVWLKIDTGMHRLGLEPSQFAAAYDQLSSNKNVANIVVMTHFASADNLQSDYTEQQLKIFDQALAGRNVQCSVGNSAGLVNWPAARRDWLRSGILLYGVAPNPQVPLPFELTPAMTLLSPVVALRTIAEGASVGYGGRWQAKRPTRIATLALGYGDGYPRHAKDGTPVWLNGQRVALVGRVSMDMITVDVTDLAEVKVGDEAELWGKNLSVNEVADDCDSISYELLTRVSPRVPRQIF